MLTLAVVAAVLVLFAATALLARAQVARAGAQTAADLGALAAAGWLAEAGRLEGAAPPDDGTAIPDGDSACAVAREVVAANGAELAECVLVGHGVVRVSTVRDGGLGTARASARAGPRGSG